MIVETSVAKNCVTCSLYAATARARCASEATSVASSVAASLLSAADVVAPLPPAFAALGAAMSALVPPKFMIPVGLNILAKYGAPLPPPAFRKAPAFRSASLRSFSRPMKSVRASAAPTASKRAAKSAASLFDWWAGEAEEFIMLMLSLVVLVLW